MNSSDTVSDPIFIDGMPTFFDPDQVLQGTPDDDVLKGDRKLIIIAGNGGSDRIIGGKNASRLSGGNGDDVIKGNVSSDRLSGGLGNDRLQGNDGNDVLYGDQDNDVLRGNAGDDVLFGGLGRNRLIGGEGADAFVLEFNTDGFNRIRDFEDGVDKLGIFGANVYSMTRVMPPNQDKLEALIDDLTIKQRGSNTVIKSEGQAIAVLANVDATTITASDFAPIIIAV